MTPVCGFPCEGTHNACIARPNCSPCSRRATATLRIPLCHQVAIRSTRRPIAAASARHGRKGFCCRSSLLDQAWGTHVNAQVETKVAHKPILAPVDAPLHLQELATNIFSTSIVPYSAFLYWLTKSRKTPPLALFGFYFLLVFVFATIPAGVVGKSTLCLAVHYYQQVCRPWPCWHT